jgi:hypothetical protein
MRNRGTPIRLRIPAVQLESRGRKWRQHVGWLLSVSLLVACNQEEMLQKFASPEEQAVAKKYIDQLRNRDFGEIEKAADPSIAGASLEDALKTMADLIPADPPVSVQLVGAHRMSSTSSGTVVNLTFEYRFHDRFVLANVATKIINGVTSIVGFHVQPESGSLESRNRFNIGRQERTAIWRSNIGRRGGDFYALRFGGLYQDKIEATKMAVGTFHPFWIRQVIR